MREIVKMGDDFLFSKTTGESLAFFRLFFGGVLILNAIIMSTDLLTWYGPLGVYSLETYKANTQDVFNLFKFLPASDFSVYFLFGIHMVSAYFLAVGFWTNLSAAFAFITLVSFQDRNYGVLNSGDIVLRLFLLFLIFAPSNRFYSVDAKNALKKGNPLQQNISTYMLRFGQVQLMFIYLIATIQKLNGDTWLNGETVYYVSRLADFERFRVPFIFENMITLKLLTWATLVIEFAGGALLWIKELRYPTLLALLCLHLGLEISLNIPIFQWAMISTLILFLEPKDSARIVNWIQTTVIKLKTFIHRLSKLNPSK